jgi:hypothetical protein
MLVLVGMDQERFSSVLFLDFIFGGSNWQIENIIRAREIDDGVSRVVFEFIKCKEGSGLTYLSLKARRIRSTSSSRIKSLASFATACSRSLLLDMVRLRKDGIGCRV